MDPQVRGSRQDALSERQNAFHVQFFELRGVLVDLEQGHLLAHAIRVAIVGIDVYRPLEQERLVQTIQFLLKLLPGLLGRLKVGLDRGLTLLPYLNDRLFQ